MMKKIVILFIVFLISCTSNESTSTESTVDDDGYTTTTLSSNILSLKWRVVDDTYLEGALIGDPGSDGWIAVGFGQSSMHSSQILVAQNGTDINSVLDATGYNYGLSNNSTTIINSSEISISGTEITASFNIGIDDANISLTESTSVIWAYKAVSQAAQSNLDNIGKHNSRGSVTINFQ